MIEEKQHELNNIIIQRCYRNQSIKIQKFNLSIAKSIATSIRFYSANRTISLIVFLSFARQQSHESSTSIYSTIFSTIARLFYSLQLEKNSEIHVFASQIDVFFSISFETTLQLVRSHQNLSIYLFVSHRIFITNRDIWRKYTRLHVKSTRSFRFCSENISIRSPWILFFLFFCDNRISNFFSLKTLFTYDERLATLKSCLKFLETSRHFKTIMIVVDISKNDHSDFNVMQCIICSLLIYDEYFTFESLKKHFQNASHCSFALQFQQKIESKKIVEKSKIESFSVLVSLVKSLSTYEEKLTILTNWIWFDTLSRKTMTIAEFKSIHDEYKTKCMHCSLTITSNRKFESLKKHFQKSFECSFVLQLEISKSTFVVVDIEYFDSTFLCDIQKFDLHHESTNFSQHLQNIRINYREKKLLSLLLECFRDFALFWYKQQNEIEIAKNLNEWLKVLIIAFSTKFSKFEIFFLFRLFFVSRFSIIRVWIASRFSRHWFDYCNIFKKSFAKRSFANIAKKSLIQKINFTNTFANIMQRKKWINSLRDETSIEKKIKIQQFHQQFQNQSHQQQ